MGRLLEMSYSRQAWGFPQELPGSESQRGSEKGQVAANLGWRNFGRTVCRGDSQLRGLLPE